MTKMKSSEPTQRYDFAIIGGDKRQVYLAEMLADRGYQILVYAIDSLSAPLGCKQAESCKQAIVMSENIIAPIPMTLNKIDILHKTKQGDMAIDNLKDFMGNGQKLFAGCIPGNVAAFCEEKGIEYYDFMKDETIAVFNSIATAEGVIAEAIINSPSNLHNSNCLVLGFGKCGKTLADKLKGLSGKVTVCVRDNSKKVLADAYGLQVISIGELKESVGIFDFIFNTIPAIVLDYEILKVVKSSAMIFDIATAPGGVDYDKAKKLGIKANIYPGLPGKYAAKSSAIALADYVIIHKK